MHELGPILLVSEHDARRAAWTLHSRVGQALIAAMMELQLHGSEAVPPDSVQDVVKLLREGLNLLRDVTAELRPPLLQEGGLEPALRGLVDRNPGHERLRLHCALAQPRAAGVSEAAVYRIVESVVAHWLRHTAAGHCEISLEDDDDNLMLSLEAEAPSGKEPPGTEELLQAIRLRTALAGGRCAVEEWARAHRLRAVLPR